MRDGMGVERLSRLVNVETGIITGEESEIVRCRVEKLAIKEYHPGSRDKLFTLNEIIRDRDLQAEQIAYIGDDSNDLEIMNHVGLSACPADAFSMIREAAHLVMANNGGQGAFREFAEIIIFLKQNSR
jgi:3-deoxy-D-manno-octulosonate 8-phosphate phosphatase (KDO 8-P phosphatase)